MLVYTNVGDFFVYLINVIRNFKNLYSMKKYLAIALLLSFLSYGCLANTQNPRKPKSATDKRIKKQKQHQKKHPCPQIDC